MTRTQTTPSDDISELYQETIIEHSRNPRNYAAMDEPSLVQEGYNPLCGDSITIYLKLENNVIRDASFQAAGCAISRAAASLLIEQLKGLTAEAAKKLIENYRNTLLQNEESNTCDLGDLVLLQNVRRFPVRIKCALLAGNTVLKALQK